LINALDALEDDYRSVAAFPLETLSRSEGRALIARLDKLDQKLVALQRRLSGRLISVDRRASA
jgi:hypothetical protein